MSSQSVVILTEPANCEHVDANLLLQAVLETQRLNSEGIQVSQTFCDNPAAAAEFVEAYAKAYPGLEQQSPSLPSPEQLYSIIANGGLTSLQYPKSTAAGQTTFQGSDALHPLVVLSLGKPETFMQALQGNRSMRNSINVIDISPTTETQGASMSVAAAVAGHGIANTSLSAGSRGLERDEDALQASEDGANATLKLESSEFNSDYIRGRANEDQAHSGAPSAAVVSTTPVSSVIDSSEGPPGQVNAAPAGGSITGSLTFAQGPALEAGSAAVSGSTNPTVGVPEPTVLAGDTYHPVFEAADVPEDTPAPPVQGSEGRHDIAVEPETGAADSDVGEPGEGAPDETSPADVVQSPNEPGENGVGPDTIAGGPNSTEPMNEGVGDERSSFSEPGDDVVYSPTGTFTPDDDLSYPLPAPAPDADSFGSAIRTSMADDIIDVEVIFSSGVVDLPEATEAFDPFLTRPPGPTGHDERDVYGPGQDAYVGHPDLPGADQDNHQDKTITPVHDLDI